LLYTKVRTEKKKEKTHCKPILPINLLIILGSKHITKVPDGRIMHDRNLIPPLLLRPIMGTSRIRVRRRRRLDDVADEFGVSAAFRGDGGEALSYIVVRLGATEWTGTMPKSGKREGGTVHTCPYLK
jgi:hypothetical protein